jgi:PAS domain S-box-containing protein
MSIPLRVLIVEDSESDTQLLLHELRRGGYQPAFTRVDNAKAMCEALESQDWDLVIADHAMPQFSAPEALHILQDRNLDLPFIILSGSMSQEMAVSAMKAGAHDFIMKGMMARLIPAIERELREARIRWERKQAEIGRQESEARYRSLFQNNHTVMLLIDPVNALIVDANPAACEFYGYPAEQIKQMPVRHIDLSAPEDLQEHLRLAQQSQQRHFYFRHRLSTGDLRDVESFAGPIQIQGQTLIYSIIHDITERKRTEEQLRKLSRAVEQSPSTVLITDIRGCIEYMNPQFTATTGYTASEALGKNPRILKSGETPPEVYRRMWETICSGHEWHGEFHNQRKNGELYWEYAAIAPVTNEAGVVTHFVAVKEDITELKKAEEALRASEVRYRSLVEASPNAISLIGIDRRLQMINRCGIELLGYATESEIVGRPYEQFVRPEDRKRVEAAMQELMPKGRVDNFQLPLLRKDGSYVFVELSGSLICGEPGQPQSILVAGGDISERKRAEEALKKANRDLEAMNRQLAEASERSQRLAQAALIANQAKNQFLANVSHEIRTPMSGILVTVNLLQEMSLSTEQREYVQTLEHSARILLNIINDILDFSKLEADKLELESIDFELHDTLQTLMKVLMIQANAKGLTMRCQIDEQVPACLRGDPIRLRQILINLVDNAIKFTDRGEIKVSVKLADEDCVAELIRSRTGASGSAEGGDSARKRETGHPLPEGKKCWLYFSVSDTGIGIPPGKLDSIFEAFTQADSSTTRKYGGTGLGLTIGVRLVSLMGGRIWVESTVGQGSTFHFLVCFGRAETSSAPAQAPIEPSPPTTDIVLPPLRILLVEDNRINQRTVRRLLEKRGHAVKVADNGEVALRDLDQQPFDLVLMDVHMPVLDGYAATSAIRGREHDTGKHIPIVAMTANAMKGDEDRCLAAGMDGYVSKPIQVRELLTVISQITTKARPAISKTRREYTARLVFDIQEALAQVEGDEAELRLLVGMFLEEEPQALAAIREALVREDRATLMLTLHNLKGMISSLGGYLAAEAADQLEQLGNHGTQQELEKALSHLDSELDRLRPILKNLEAGNPI